MSIKIPYKGIPTKGVDFFNILFESDEFASELGKVSLAAGKLEAELILFFKCKNITNNFEKSTLGSLIKIGATNNLLDKSLLLCLEMVCKQRNYLTHNIYSLFIDLKEETILERDNLLDSDVVTYTEKAFILRENLTDMAEIIKKMRVENR